MKSVSIHLAASVLIIWLPLPVLATELPRNGIMTHSKVELCTPLSPQGTQPCRDYKIPPESYTRLIIENVMPSETDKFPNAKRGGINRFFSSKDIIFQASLATETGRFKDVTPLLYRRYESARRKGETFIREISFDERQFPLFLVTGDPTSQIARFTLEARFDNKPSTDTAELSLGFLTTALKAVSPGSAVVTTLTSDNADKVATKIDESFGKFFSESVSEKSRFDIDLYDFKPKLITVYGGRTEDASLNPEAIIGQWLISFAPARPSIFSSVICAPHSVSGACANDQKKAAFGDAKLRPNAVLAFALIDKVGSSGTVLSYLKQQDWWATDLVALSNKGAEFGSFCRKIRGVVGEIGLSDTDGRIIAYAVSESGSVSPSIKAGMQNEADCKYDN